MISQVNSLIISKPKAVLTKNNNNTSFYGQAVSIPLEQKDGKDVVAINKKSKLSKKQKTWVKIGTVVAAIAAVAVTAREVFIKKAQKVFKEAFLRDDINRKETIKILKRYKDIGKIKDKNEYIRAVYEEGKKNFGLNDLKLNFSIEEFADKAVNGQYETGVASVKINKNIRNSRIINTVHHELRHVKQANLMINYSPLEYARAVLKSKGKPFEAYLNDLNFLRAMNDKYYRTHGVTRNPNSVPKSLEDYVKKLIKAQEVYVEGYLVNGKPNKEYYNNFKEVDARKCGDSLEKILKWVKFWR